METNIFQEIQERFSIIDVAKSLGLRIKRVGSSYRSDSIDGDGGENALVFYESSNSWYDFKLQIGGDIASLVAQVKFGGSVKDAIHDLLPDRDNHRVSEELKAKKHFMDNIERWSNNIFDSTRKSSVNALNYPHKRGITDDTIKQLKIGVDPSDARGEFRILIPYWDEAGKNILYYTTRKYDWTGNGENKDSPKYKKLRWSSIRFSATLRWV